MNNKIKLIGISYGNPNLLNLSEVAYYLFFPVLAGKNLF